MKPHVTRSSANQVLKVKRLREASSPITFYGIMKILFELTKFRISFFATLSAFAGFVLAKGGISEEMIIPLLGIFFLACGSSALNQCQEREIDGAMERTKGRPLPSGRVNPRTALWISLILIISGSLILGHGTDWRTLALGLFAVVWYNGFYTYSKRKTAFAAIPGALIGMIPPALGWISGGGSILNPRIWGIGFFFFIWQVPHFWLLSLDFAKDYEKIGLPSLTKILTKDQVKRLIFLWILSAATSSLTIPLFGFINFYSTLFLLLAATLWLIWNVVNFLRSYSEGVSLKMTFARLNIYVFFVISLLSLEKLFDFSDINLTVTSRVLAIIRITNI